MLREGFRRLCESSKQSARGDNHCDGDLPRNDDMSFMPIINTINGNLSKIADGQKVRYLNINEKLADNNGRLSRG